MLLFNLCVSKSLATEAKEGTGTECPDELYLKDEFGKYKYKLIGVADQEFGGDVPHVVAKIRLKDGSTWYKVNDFPSNKVTRTEFERSYKQPRYVFYEREEVLYD